jgi:hypothetical protein
MSQWFPKSLNVHRFQSANRHLNLLRFANPDRDVTTTIITPVVFGFGFVYLSCVELMAL